MDRKPSLFTNSMATYAPGSVVVAEPKLSEDDIERVRNHAWRKDRTLYDYLEAQKTTSLYAVWGSERIFVLYGGVIHVYADRSYAEIAMERQSLRALQAQIHFPDHNRRTDRLIVIAVKCRPEHYVAWGDNGDLAYTQVEVLD